ncbi:MAG: TatD family hydrolase [Eubacteriaceae bacterium]|nr:TatD family hydrolase [Eubacteriaceae bacterium]
MLFDAHSHINSEDFTEEERKIRISEIEENEKLKYVMDIGCDLETSRMAAAHGKRYSWCFAAVGFHPHYASGMGDSELAVIKELAGLPDVKAIGEIGLDFHYDYSPRDVQRECFRKQIRLALELKMPIVIHSREADGETMDILVEEGAFSEERKALFPKRPVPEGWEKAEGDARVMLHCFSGSDQLAEQYVKNGAWISIAGPVTYKNNRKTVKVVEHIPAEFLTAETDSPFLTPEPLRGRPNRSSYVEHTVRRMAVIKGIDVSEMEDEACRNAERFYNI